jgi:hypothetical protein
MCCEAHFARNSHMKFPHCPVVSSYHRGARVIIMIDAVMRDKYGKALTGHNQRTVFAVHLLLVGCLAAYLQTTPGAKSKMYCMGKLQIRA